MWNFRLFEPGANQIRFSSLFFKFCWNKSENPQLNTSEGENEIVIFGFTVFRLYRISPKNSLFTNKITVKDQIFWNFRPEILKALRSFLIEKLSFSNENNTISDFSRIPKFFQFHAKIFPISCQNVIIWALKNNFKSCSKVHRKEKDRFILNNYKGECPSRSFALWTFSKVIVVKMLQLLLVILFPKYTILLY